jgi:hypothetical protein
VKLKIVIPVLVVLLFGILAFSFLANHSTKADVIANVFSNLCNLSAVVAALRRNQVRLRQCQCVATGANDDGSFSRHY